MTSSPNHYGVVILAAGSSSRLGRAKQLVKFNGKSLLQITTEAAISAAGKQVIVVTGANKELLDAELADLSAHVIHNEYWQEGMASSIYFGLISLLKLFPYLNGIIFSVCDQPYISASIFNDLIQKKSQTGKGIISAWYNDTAGVPVLFGHEYFVELIDLQGQEGAKALLKKHAGDVSTIPFPVGSIDIDTTDDLVNLHSCNFI